MGIFLNAIKLTKRQRRLLSGVVMVMALTSSQVQAAGLSDIVPAVRFIAAESAKSEAETPVWGLVVPDDRLDKPAEEAGEQEDADEPKGEAPKPVKKVWNRINAPDLDTQAEHSDEPAVRTFTVPATAYTSDPRECDSTPFTTANGTRVRDGIVAANFLPFGTRFRIPDYFGDKVFEVHDRMNARYWKRIDIWMLEKPDARAWGVRRVKIEILP